MSTEKRFFVGFVQLGGVILQPCVHNLKTGRSYIYSELAKLPIYHGHILGKDYRQITTYEVSFQLQTEKFQAFSAEDIQKFEKIMDAQLDKTKH